MTDFDAIVVGSGAAGAAVAWRLCSQGFKVACIERGPRMDADAYPSANANWEWHKAKDANPVAATRNLPGDYPIDDTDSPIAVCNFNAVGGSTLLYSAHFPRFRPPDFHTRTSEGVGLDWPLSYEQLRPYFERNEQEMSVSGLAGDPAYPDIKNLLPPVPLGQAGTILARAFNARGWHWWPSYAAISTRERNGRPACLNLGPCNTGCPQGAKSSSDVTYLKKAEALGLVLLPNTSVSHVLVEDGHTVGVACFDKQGSGFEMRARHIVLSAGALGTPRILLNSTSEAHPSGLGNSSDQLGRNLMLHPLGYVEGIFTDLLDTDIGPQGCMLYSHQFYRDPTSDHDLGYMMHALRGGGAAESALSAFGRRKLQFGPRVYDDFETFYRKQLVITIICEDQPEPSNRIELMPGRVDRFGTPGLRVKYKLHHNSKKLLKHGMSRARELMASAGAQKSYAFGPVRNTGWHIMGTARMGKDKLQSVVDSKGACHDVSGLSIADASVFVTGSCVNPANTIQALALYISDQIIRKLH